MLHIPDGPQLSEAVSTGGAEAANLNSPEDFDTPHGYAMQYGATIRGPP